MKSKSILLALISVIGMSVALAAIFYKTNAATLSASGSFFPKSATTVTCTTEAEPACAFAVPVNDLTALTITCPANFNLQCPSTIVYSALEVTDDCPGGASVTCNPPSGSTFALGTTTVNCTAMGAAGHHAACSFLVNVSSGSSSLRLLIPGGKSAVEFGAQAPVTVKRKSKKANGPCGLFTIENTSVASIVLTLDAINRAGSDVDGQHISNPREASLYALSILNANGGETPLAVGQTVTLAAGERKNFCLRVNLVVPGLVGSSTNLSAPQAIPDLIDTRVIFKLANGSSLVVNVTVHVETAVRFINPNNPRRPATPSFTTSGNDFAVSFAVFDPNLDVNRAKYEFFDAGGAVVAGPFDIDLVQAIRERNLVRGQSFAVTQHFIEANSNRQISAVRVTIFDGEASVASPITPLGTAATNITVQAASQLRFKPDTDVTPTPFERDWRCVTVFTFRLDANMLSRPIGALTAHGCLILSGDLQD